MLEDNLCADDILDQRGRRVVLSHQGGAVNCPVLEKLRMALHRNEMFNHLVLSDNYLNDDCIATVSALIKDRNFIVKYEMENCSINDRQLTLHLVPALLLKKRVTSLFIDRNTDLTDECVDSLCQLMVETNLTELTVVGAKLTERGGEKIANALERTSVMTLCKMPFSVGFKVLDRIKLLIRRNKTQFSAMGRPMVHQAPEFVSSPEEWNYKDQQAIQRYHSKKQRREALIQGRQSNPHNGFQGGLTLPHLRSEATSHLYDPGSRQVNSPRVRNTRSMINSWADPSVKHTFLSLNMLEERSKLRTRYRKIKASENHADNGLDPESVAHARQARNLPVINQPTQRRTLIE